MATVPLEAPPVQCDPSFADELRMAVFGPAPRADAPVAGDGPTPLDQAWHEGLGLGLERVPANPPAEYSAAERAAWLRGYDSGAESAAFEALAEHEAWVEAMESAIAARDLSGCDHAGDLFGFDDGNEWEGR